MMDCESWLKLKSDVALSFWLVTSYHDFEMGLSFLELLFCYLATYSSYIWKMNCGSSKSARFKYFHLWDYGILMMGGGAQLWWSFTWKQRTVNCLDKALNKCNFCSRYFFVMLLLTSSGFKSDKSATFFYSRSTSMISLPFFSKAATSNRAGSWVSGQSTLSRSTSLVGRMNQWRDWPQYWAPTFQKSDHEGMHELD